MYCELKCNLFLGSVEQQDTLQMRFLLLLTYLVLSLVVPH